MSERELALTKLVNDARALAVTAKDIDLRGALMLTASMIVAQFVLRPSVDQIVELSHALVAIVNTMPTGIPEPPI
jgi:hypothetical protein